MAKKKTVTIKFTTLYILGLGFILGFASHNFVVFAFDTTADILVDAPHNVVNFFKQLGK